ncbi:MAG TPA: RNA polymerase sigma factor [Humibacillus sp.]|nr:RNA polymerase sigma factor [Humibacillus sp.]
MNRTGDGGVEGSSGGHDGAEGTVVGGTEAAIDTAEEAAALARVRAGDASAYAVLVVLHAPIAKRLAVLSGAGSEADDVVQEAFVKAYQSLPRFHEGAGFRPWLLRIVVNETRNLQRSRSRRVLRELRVAWEEAVTRGVPDPSEAAVSRDRRSGLIDAVEGLPDDLREIVTCRYLLELSEAETAETLGIPAGTVKSRLHRALGSLRAVMADA